MFDILDLSLCCCLMWAGIRFRNLIRFMSYIFGKNSQLTLWTSSCITSDSDVWCPSLINYLLIIYLSTGGVFVLGHMWRGQRTACRRWFSPSLWVLHTGIETGRMARLSSRCSPISHLTSQDAPVLAMWRLMVCSIHSSLSSLYSGITVWFRGLHFLRPISS